MNTKGRTKGQLILVAGFLVAIAIIGVAMTLSGVFFTQNVDESGLSQFESSATSQQASADVAAQRSVELTNLFSERNNGTDASNITTRLVNYLKNYTKTTQNVSQLQAVVNVSVNETTLNRSWVSGREKPGVLPGWNLTDTRTINRTENRTIGRSPFDIAYTLDISGSMGNDAYAVGIDVEVCESWSWSLFGRYCSSSGDATIIGGPNGSSWRVEYTNGTKEWVDESDIIDSSVSKLDRAKEANMRAIGAMNDSDRAALVGYEADASLVRTLTNMTSSGKSDMNNSIDSLSSGGNTNITEGLEVAREHLANEGDNSVNDSDYMVLLSDGRNTVGPDAYCDYPSDPCSATLSQADQAADQNITIYTIAFGSDADEELMQEIASRTGGNYTKASADDLINILQQIIDEIEDDLPPQTITTTTSQPTLSETIDKIYELQLNVTEFNNTEDISIEITNTTQNATGVNVTETVWKLTVDNNGPSGYDLNLGSETNPGINKSMTVSDDLMNNDSNWVRFDVMDNFAETQSDVVTPPSDTFDLRPDVIKSHYPVSFSMDNNNKSANGTFRFEFKPAGGTMNGSSITGICPPNQTTCGYQTNSNFTYSTARIRHATVSVSYNSASGDYENEIEVDAD